MSISLIHPSFFSSSAFPPPLSLFPSSHPQPRSQPRSRPHPRTTKVLIQDYQIPAMRFPYVRIPMNALPFFLSLCLFMTDWTRRIRYIPGTSPLLSPHKTVSFSSIYISPWYHLMFHFHLSCAGACIFLTSVP